MRFEKEGKEIKPRRKKADWQAVLDPKEALMLR
jgi:hypothetical protein